MPADADAAFAVQPPFALPFAAGVLKHRLAAGGVAVAEDAIRNQLFEARILLHFAAQAEGRVGRVQEFGQVPIDIGRQKALKVSEPMKQRGRDDQNSFGMDFRHESASFRGEIKRQDTTRQYKELAPRNGGPSEY